MADFNQIPSGQTSIAIPVTAITFTASSADPIWQVPTWPQATASFGGISFGGGGVTFPTTGQQWPLGNS